MDLEPPLKSMQKMIDEQAKRKAQREWSFVVDAPVMGAVRMTQRSKWCNPRARAYLAYQKRVRLLANVAGVPDEIQEDERAALEVVVYWKRKARADLDNCCKGILDSLWTQDRRVNLFTATAVEHAKAERAEVRVRIEKMANVKK